jgi:hypothetical protein
MRWCGLSRWQAVLPCFRLRHLIRLHVSGVLRRCRRRLGYGDGFGSDAVDGDAVDDALVWSPDVKGGSVTGVLPPALLPLVAQRAADASDIVAVPVAQLTR